MDSFTLRYIRLTLRIENHFIDVSLSAKRELRLALRPEPIGFEHNVKDVHEEDEKENAN